VPYIVRILNNKTHWEDDPANKSWLQSGEIRSDLLNDFETKDDCLSIYIIDEDNDIDIFRVISAIASTKDHFDKIDYTIFDISVLSGLKAKLEDNPGKTPDSYVNDLHSDVIEISADQRLLITKIVKQKGLRFRMSKNTVERYVIQYHKSGFINTSLMKPTLRGKLEA